MPYYKYSFQSVGRLNPRYGVLYAKNPDELKTAIMDKYKDDPYNLNYEEWTPPAETNFTNAWEESGIKMYKIYYTPVNTREEKETSVFATSLRDAKQNARKLLQHNNINGIITGVQFYDSYYERV